MVHFFERNFIAGNTTKCAGQTRKPRSIRGMCQSSATRILNIQGEIKDIVYKAKKKKKIKSRLSSDLAFTTKSNLFTIQFLSYEVK